jgi:hypothetical protein
MIPHKPTFQWRKKTSGHRNPDTMQSNIDLDDSPM